jgi:hypothetical protein
MQEPPVNDNDLCWDLKGPDAEGDVWFLDEAEGHGAMINLGPFDAVATKLADWLAERDFGEQS